MRISFDEHSVELCLWDTKKQMTSFLNSCGEGNLLFESQEQEVEFHSATVWLKGDPEHKFGVGICSEGHGLVPHILPLPMISTLAFGFNSNAVGVSFPKGEVVFSFNLDSLFYSFILVPEQKVLLIQHEIGLVALEEDGQFIWRFSRDIITNVVVEKEKIYLEFVDSPFVQLNITNGEEV